LEVVPGAYWEAEIPMIAGAMSLLTVVAENKTGPFVVAPSCHGLLASNVTDPWAVSTKAAFYLNQTEPGDAEVCVCETVCEAISPLGPAGLPGWDRVLVTYPTSTNASFEVVARGVTAEIVTAITIVGKNYGDSPSLSLGCGCASVAPTSVNPLTYDVPPHPEVQLDKVELCVDVDGVLTYVGPLFITRMDIAKVSAEGLKLALTGTVMSTEDRVVLPLPGLPCTQPEAGPLQPAPGGTATKMEFVAPEGRYKVCFCDYFATGDCTNLKNYFEVLAEVDFVEAEGLSCLTAQPQLLQPKCEATTDVVPGVPVKVGKGAKAYYAAPPVNYSYECYFDGPKTPSPTPAPTAKDARRRVASWIFPQCNTSHTPVPWP